MDLVILLRLGIMILLGLTTISLMLLPEVLIARVVLMPARNIKIAVGEELAPGERAHANAV